MFGLNRCGPLRPLLWEYADGTLDDDAARARIERHLAGCPACREELAALRRPAAALGDFAANAAAAVPERPGDWEGVRARIQSPAAAPSSAPSRRRPLLAPALGLTCAALAVSAVAVVAPALFAPDEPPVYEMRPQGGGFVQAGGVPYGDQAAVRMSADPVFAMLPARGTFPLSVNIENTTGRAMRGNLRVSPGSASATGRIYEYAVELPANGKRKATVYPSLSAYGNMGNVTLVLTGPFPTRTQVIGPSYDGNAATNNRAFGYIGDGFGVLTGNWRGRGQERQRDQTPPYAFGYAKGDQMPTPYSVGYAKPENAPDRAVGFDSVDFLVLGKGSERLRPDQWRAIRQWVLGGGSLILTDGDRETYLTNPAVADLAPVRLEARNSGPSSALRFNAPDAGPRGLTNQAVNLRLPEDPVPVTVAAVRPDAESLDWYGTHRVGDTVRPGGMRQRRSTLARRQLGAGTVLYLGCDPTTPPFRSWEGVEQFWGGVASLARPSVAAKNLRVAALSTSPTVPADSGSLPLRTADPFRITLPSVGTVLNCFAFYFLLAVPVTFVTLKRMRRMEWGWATGPALAVVTAGAMALLTASLYTAKLSRRTAGVLVGSATGEARFVGFTELFFPHAGSYRIAVPGAEEFEVEAADVSVYASPAARRPLQTEEGEGGTLGADLSVANLSFRRVYHTQTLTLGNGIQGSAFRRTDGQWSVEVRNATGRTLENAYLLLPARVVKRGNGYVRESTPLGFSLGSLRPGSAARRVGTPSLLPQALMLKLSPVSQDQFRNGPMLFGQVSGEGFGPNLGKWVGSGGSVTAIFPVPVAEPDPPIPVKYPLRTGPALPAAPPSPPLPPTAPVAPAAPTAPVLEGGRP